MSRFLRFVITGAPGSGKGTISSWIVRDFGLRHVAAGDLLRSQIKDKTGQCVQLRHSCLSFVKHLTSTDIGTEALKYISKGQLVPNDLVTRLVFEELNRNVSSHWLIDGFPRNVEQAKSLDQFCSLTAVIDLLVPHEEIINRIKGRLIHEASGRVYNTEYKPPKQAGRDDVTGEPLVQRQDDQPDVVKARLVAYDQQTAPVLHHYRQQGLLHQFTGTTSDQIYVHAKQFLHKVTS